MVGPTRRERFDYWASGETEFRRLRIHKSRLIRWINTQTVADSVKLRKCKGEFVKCCELHGIDLNNDRILKLVQIRDKCINVLGIYLDT